MQRHRFFRRFAFPLCGGDDHQQALLRYLFELVVAGADQRGAQIGGQQIVAQLLRQAARIAGLRSGNDGDGGRSRRGGRRNGHGSGLLIDHAPKITGQPRQLRRRIVADRRL